MSLTDTQLSTIQGNISSNVQTIITELQRLRNTYEPITPPLQLAVPSYFYATSPFWAQMYSAHVKIAVINPNSGPGTSIDPNYLITVKNAQAAGVMVLGYVDTSYGKIPLATVEANVNDYYQWYGVDGIFFDQCSDAHLSYYTSIFDFVKSKTGKAFVALNPGTRVPETYAAISDLICTCEATATNYQNWKPMGWEVNYPPSHFWHLVYAATAEQLPWIMALAKANHIGYVYLTSDNLPNPWDTLPTGTFWATELSLL